MSTPPLGSGYVDQNVQLLTPAEAECLARHKLGLRRVAIEPGILTAMGTFARPTGPETMLEPATCGTGSATTGCA